MEKKRASSGKQKEWRNQNPGKRSGSGVGYQVLFHYLTLPCWFPGLFGKCVYGRGNGKKGAREECLCVSKPRHQCECVCEHDFDLRVCLKARPSLAHKWAFTDIGWMDHWMYKKTGTI